MMAKAKASKVTVFGGASIDRLAQSAGPVIAGVSNPGTVHAAPGGVGFNVAVSLARLGVPVRLVAILGDDADGDRVVAEAHLAGVDTSAVLRSASLPTATYQASFDPQGELIVGIADMAIYDGFDEATVAPIIAADDAPLWVVDTNLPSPTLDCIVGEAATRNRRVAALAVSPAKATRLTPLLDRLNFLFANRREALAILDRSAENGTPSPAELAAELAPRGAGVVITNAAGTISATAGGNTRSFAPFRAEIVSVNGAGDALAAGTIYGLAKGCTLFDSLRSGLAAAALAIESGHTVSTALSPKSLTERIAAGGRSP